MADIAMLFHWPPSVTGSMTLTELLDWREKAIIRRGAQDE
ncbi:GpE family phage tail protein [Candidatus Fukatsuia symbiotica]|uniref:GpE family phage tail protein n=1 Tax=Candidatus Fukatsuia symbiotica TaxID=1878942 RepID=A0A2U8I6F5_9GAMM|nr:GpE family phage tail protein [Candidatus Fukatsuia symbiotica]AWK14761.1 GpE family phage tail protein [Candidatus Fukatsuia symbiotica]MEA9445095.1 GpE family phage tail protein [Candidatus Fukatsuia symbiotica]